MSALRYTAAFSAACLIALVTAEVGVRAFDVMDRVNLHPRRLYERVDDPRLPYRLRPGERDIALPGSSIRVNAHGLRGPELAAERERGVRRILLLGDSATFGWGLEEPAALPARLAAALADLGVRSEVLNGGTPGYTTRSELAFLERFGLALEPDSVVLVVSLNDFDRSPSLNAHGFMTNEDAGEEGWLARHSELSVVLRSLAGPWRSIGGDTVAREKLERFLTAHAIRMRESFYADPEPGRWNETAAALRGIRDLAASAGIEFSVAVLPERDQLGPDSASPVPQSQWRALCELLALRCLDLWPAFVASGQGDALFRDLQHLAEPGTRLAAEQLAQQLSAPTP